MKYIVYQDTGLGINILEVERKENRSYGADHVEYIKNISLLDPILPGPKS